LKCLFEGRKDLFKGLFVYDKWDWDKKYPVIRIDFSKGVVKTNYRDTILNSNIVIDLIGKPASN